MKVRNVSLLEIIFKIVICERYKVTADDSMGPFVASDEESKVHVRYSMIDDQ